MGDEMNPNNEEAMNRRAELCAMLEIGEKELDAGLGIAAEEVFRRLEQRAAELDRSKNTRQ
jgi:hypothetical protein